MSKNYVVEESFDCKGLPCCVIMTTMGHRCGYVGVYKNNKFWGCNYIDVEFFNDIPDVHGGLTYSSNNPDSGYPIETNGDVWWFGFDCGHYTDKCDIEAVKKYFPEYAEKLYFNDWNDGICDQGVVRTEEYVHGECISLAGWLSKYTNDEYLNEKDECQEIINSISHDLFEVNSELKSLKENIECGDITTPEICSKLKKIINEIGE